MRQIFRNSALNEAFENDGYVDFPFLDSSQIAAVMELVKRLNQESNASLAEVDSSYRLSFFNPNAEMRTRINDEITAVIQPLVDELIIDFSTTIVNIFDKEPGSGMVPLHQNWTFVDEDKFRSLTLWVPLINTTRRNGTLEVVKGSHGVLTKYRSASIPWVFQDIIDPIIEKYSDPINLELGQAAMIDDSIIHYSSDNNSDQSRIIFQLLMGPKEATTIHYFWHPQTPDRLEVFEVDRAFFTRFNQNKKPSSVKSLGFIPYKHKNLTEEEFVERVATNNPQIRDRV